MIHHDPYFSWNAETVSQLISQFQKASRNVKLDDDVRSYANAFEANMLLFGDGMEMNTSAMKAFICIVTDAKISNTEVVGKLKPIYFSWDTEKGQKILKKLEEAPVDTNLSQETRTVAGLLFNSGCYNQYIIRMNNFFMEHFIRIITNTL